jgi:predicted unusual protein kinase regulating ubiquinone biosynthesis (AarF/ABC1/UbiB family)
VFRLRCWLLDQSWSYPGGFTEAKKKDRQRGLARYLLEQVGLDDLTAVPTCQHAPLHTAHSLTRPPLPYSVIALQVLNLGPTFIKLGQLGSTRSDLFPAGG